VSARLLLCTWRISVASISARPKLATTMLLNTLMGLRHMIHAGCSSPKVCAGITRMHAAGTLVHTLRAGTACCHRHTATSGATVGATSAAPHTCVLFLHLDGISTVLEISERVSGVVAGFVRQHAHSAVTTVVVALYVGDTLQPQLTDVYHQVVGQMARLVLPDIAVRIMLLLQPMQATPWTVLPQYLQFVHAKCHQDAVNAHTTSVLSAPRRLSAGDAAPSGPQRIGFQPLKYSAQLANAEIATPDSPGPFFTTPLTPLTELLPPVHGAPQSGNFCASTSVQSGRSHASNRTTPAANSRTQWSPVRRHYPSLTSRATMTSTSQDNILSGPSRTSNGSLACGVGDGSCSERSSDRSSDHSSDHSRRATVPTGIAAADVNCIFVDDVPVNTRVLVNLVASRVRNMRDTVSSEACQRTRTLPVVPLQTLDGHACIKHLVDHAEGYGPADELPDDVRALVDSAGFWSVPPDKQPADVLRRLMAFVSLRTSTVRMVVTDHNLGDGMSGHTLCQWMTTLEFPHTVILQSGCPMTRMEVLSSGASMVLMRPIRIGDIAEAICTAFVL
jgi:hypothetical protein